MTWKGLVNLIKHMAILRKDNLTKHMAILSNTPQSPMLKSRFLLFQSMWIIRFLHTNNSKVCQKSSSDSLDNVPGFCDTKYDCKFWNFTGVFGDNGNGDNGGDDPALAPGFF